MLAGANRAFQGERPHSDDGILSSLEAQVLNLEGKEIVVFSACKTGQGSLDYSEGSVGLVCALQIAGAKNVLMILWPVRDHQAKDFMRTFYSNWLPDGSRTAAEGLFRPTATDTGKPSIILHRPGSGLRDDAAGMTPVAGFRWRLATRRTAWAG